MCQSISIFWEEGSEAVEGKFQKKSDRISKEAMWEFLSVFQATYPSYDLEDKVISEEGGNDMTGSLNAGRAKRVIDTLQDFSAQESDPSWPKKSSQSLCLVQDPIRRELEGKDSDISISAASPDVPNQDVTDLNHQGRKVQKGRRSLKGWRKVYFTGYETSRRNSRSRGAESTPRKNNSKRESSRRTKALSEGRDSARGHCKSRSKRQKSSVEEDDLSQPWVCEERDPFTPQIWYFNFPKTRIPSHIKTYDGSEYLEDHLKIFQAAAKMECWAMPIWCHMFNSTLTENARVWFDDLPKESIDSYDDLNKAFLENYLQQKKCIKDLVKIHNIKQ
ncbi:reverse transcriptase domain-containing protein [Tanacetum coccineum]